MPANLNWDYWLGVAAERPYLSKYYHPGEWRKRLDFGTGTFGDMGCHILDPVFTALELTSPLLIRSDGGATNADNWGLDSSVQYVFPGSSHTTGALTLCWYDGNARPKSDVKALIGKTPLSVCALLDGDDTLAAIGIDDGNLEPRLVPQRGNPRLPNPQVHPGGLS